MAIKLREWSLKNIMTVVLSYIFKRTKKLLINLYYYYKQTDRSKGQTKKIAGLMNPNVSSLFDSLRPIYTFSVIKGRVFLG